MTLHVRPVATVDAAPLAALINAIIAEGGTTALETPFTPDGLADAYLVGPTVLCCHAAFDAAGTALGFQTLGTAGHLPRDWGDIGTFARVGMVRSGVGTALFAATRERAAALGLAGINATIRADNAGGLAFYSRLGFEPHGVTPAVPLRDGTPVDRVDKRLAL